MYNLFSLKDYRYILKLALPAIAGLSTQMIVSLVDTAMVGRLPDATYSLAAMGIGVLATWAVVSFFSSLATGTHVLIARRFGEKNYSACGEVLNTSIIVSLIIGIIVSIIVVLWSYDIAGFFAADNEVGIRAGNYLYYRFMGIPFFLITVSYRGFYFGIGKTKIFMYSGILANFLNSVFNYIFIFGALGNEPMGLAGAGIGSTLATICDMLFFFTVSTFPSYRNRFNNFKSLGFVKDYAINVVKIALPVSFQNIFILIGFLSFVSITGLIGTLEQAASQVIMSSLFISLMPCFGFGIAIQTLVGNNLGLENITRAKYYGYQTSIIATIYTIMVGIFFTVFPELLLNLITNDESVINTAVSALRIAGFGQIFYASGIVLANGLQASGKTFFVMMTEVIVNWFIFVPLSYLLAVYFELGLEGAWMAIPIYVIIYSIIIIREFIKGDWENLKKI